MTKEFIAKNGLIASKGNISTGNGFEYKINGGSTPLIDTSQTLGTSDIRVPSQNAVNQFIMKGNAPYTSITVNSLGVAAGDIVEATATGVRKYDITNYYTYGINDALATTGTGADTFLCIVNLYQNCFLGFRRITSNGRINCTIFWIGKDGMVVKGLDQAAILGAIKVDDGSFSAIKLSDGYIACAYAVNGAWSLRKLYLQGGTIVAGTALATGLTLTTSTVRMVLANDLTPGTNMTTGSNWIWCSFNNTVSSYLGVYEFSNVLTTAPTAVIAYTAISATTGVPSIRKGVNLCSLGSGKVMVITSGTNTTATVYSLESKTLFNDTGPINISKPSSGNTQYTSILCGMDNDKILYSYVDAANTCYVGSIYWTNDTLTNNAATVMMNGILQTRDIVLNKINDGTFMLRHSDLNVTGKMFFIYTTETSTSLSFTYSIRKDIHPGTLAQDYDLIYDSNTNFIVAAYGIGTAFNVTVNSLIDKPAIIGVADSTVANGSPVKIITSGIWDGFSSITSGELYYLSGDGKYTNLKTNTKILSGINSSTAKLLF